MTLHRPRTLHRSGGPVLGRRSVLAVAGGLGVGLLPGSEIRVRRGDLLRVELRNSLPQPTTVHWHGLALRNDMDGVPGLTQPEITAGTTFGYEFTVPDAGTYWFHPHVGTQLDRGLYAPLIVEDPDETADYDQELVAHCPGARARCAGQVDQAHGRTP